MGENAKDSTTKVSRKLTGRLREGDRIVAVKESDEPLSYVPVPRPDGGFDEYLCSNSSGLILLEGHSQAFVEEGGKVRLVFSATEFTLRSYGVTLEGLLEFAGILEDELGYDVDIVPRGGDGDG